MAKMTDITLSEVSVVDYPAHLQNGFAIIKSATPSQDRALHAALRKETMPEKTVAEVLKDLSADDIRKALSPEQLAELAPAPVEKAADATEDILKGLPDAVLAEFAKRDEAIAKMQKTADDALAEAEITKAAALDQTSIQKSKDTYTNLGFEHETVAPALRKFASQSPEAAEAIETMLKAVNAQADGAIFKELGTDTAPDKGTAAASKLEELAKAKSTADGTPFHKAFADVVADPANAETVAAHFKENN